MNEYIFRMPRDVPEMTYEGLDAYLGKHPSGRIGTTVTVAYHGSRRHLAAALPPAITVTLYQTRIARVMPGMVYFCPTGDAHQATHAWISRIIADNGIGGMAWRIRRQRHDPPGTPVARGRAGLLTVDGIRERPVEGHAFNVDRERIARNRERAARWDAEMAEINARIDRS